MHDAGNEHSGGALGRGLANDMGGRVGDAARPGRRAGLVGDDAQLVPLPGEAQHGTQEVLSTTGEDPARPYNQVVAPRGANGAFTGKLAASHLAAGKNDPNAAAVIEYMNPVADIHPVAIDWNRLASQRMMDCKRNKLLRELARPVIV